MRMMQETCDDDDEDMGNGLGIDSEVEKNQGEEEEWKWIEDIDDDVDGVDWSLRWWWCCA